MKKLILKASTLLMTYVVMGSNAMAQSAIIDPNTRPDASVDGEFSSNITTLINSLLAILGLIAVGFLIYAGVLMVTAGGNDEQVTKARKIITYAVIGIVIIILSWSIVGFVAGLLG